MSNIFVNPEKPTRNELKFYNIHGFIIAVDPYVDWIFQREYGHFRVAQDEVEKVDLYVKKWEGDEVLPTRRAGGTKGLLLPLRPDEKVLWYNLGMDAATILEYCEGLMWWDDKTFLHAGAVSKNGKAFVFTGGGGVGKTSLVLNFMKRGYDYIGDDWILLGKNGVAYPLPKTVHIFDYNLKDEEIARRVLGFRRYYYKFLFKLFNFGEKISPNRYLRFIFQRFKPRFHVPIQKLYPNIKIAQPTIISRILFLERKNTGNKIEVLKEEKIAELAARLAFINLFERNYFYKEYYRYAYHFNVRNEKIEKRFEHDYKIILEALKQTEVYRVIVPKNFNLTSFSPQDLIHKRI